MSDNITLDPALFNFDLEDLEWSIHRDPLDDVSLESSYHAVRDSLHAGDQGHSTTGQQGLDSSNITYTSPPSFRPSHGPPTLLPHHHPPVPSSMFDRWADDRSPDPWNPLLPHLQTGQGVGGIQTRATFASDISDNTRVAEKRVSNFQNHSSRAEPKSTATAPSAKNASLELFCPHTDCTYKGSFAGQWELQRHIQAIHEVSKIFRCPFLGCFKRQSVTAFARPDKLTSHIRSMHSVNRLCACPIEECRRLPHLPSDLLFVHLNDHLARTHSDDSLLRAICNAVSPFRPKCPIWHCQKVVPIESVHAHLEGHSQEELDASVDALRAQSIGLFVDDNFAVGVFTYCPVCGSPHRRYESLGAHIAKEHVITNSAHAESWWNYVKSLVKSPILEGTCFDDWSFLWKEWPWPSGKEIPGAKARLVCPFCGVNEGLSTGEVIKHHFHLLSDAATLQPFRMEILRLWPTFASHPVFNDVLPGNTHANDDPSNTSLTIKPTMLEATALDLSPPSSSTSKLTVNALALHNLGTRSSDSPYLSEKDSELDHRTQLYSCKEPLCEKSFPRRRDLHLHERSHQGYEQRQHACEICDKRFVYPKDVRRHLRVHEGPQYFCTVTGCESAHSGFTRKDNLDRHMAKHGLQPSVRVM